MSVITTKTSCDKFCVKCLLCNGTTTLLKSSARFVWISRLGFMSMITSSMNIYSLSASSSESSEETIQSSLLYLLIFFRNDDIFYQAKIFTQSKFLIAS